MKVQIMRAKTTVSNNYVKGKIQALANLDCPQPLDFSTQKS